MKLRSKFMLQSVITSALFSGVVVYDRVSAAREQFFTRAHDRAEYIAAFVGDASGEHMELGDTRSLRDLLAKLEHFKSIAYLRVTDLSGKVVYRQAEPGIIIGDRKPDASIYKLSDEIFDLVREITRDGVRYGDIELGVSVAGINTAVENLMWRGVTISLFFVGAIAFLMWALSRRLAGELDMLRWMAENVNEERLPDVNPFIQGEDTGKISSALLSLHARLKEESKKRRTAEAQREDFFSMTVHDLKQPVTALKAALDLLLADDEKAAFSKGQIQSLKQVAARSLGLLTTMISDVLNTAALNNPDHVIAKERIKLADFLRECEATNSVAVRASGKTWHFSLPPEMDGLWLLGDPKLLARLIGNLVQNAMQYTPEEGSVKLGAIMQGPDKVYIYVSDEGEGIPDNFREAMFEKFSSMGTSYKNIGLGLAFCKMVAERHSAIITVKSEIGRGTEIGFLIPASRISPPHAPGLSKAPAGHHSGNAKA